MQNGVQEKFYHDWELNILRIVDETKDREKRVLATQHGQEGRLDGAFINEERECRRVLHRRCVVRGDEVEGLQVDLGQ